MGKVFISYSHDSEEHAQRVLSFTNLLLKDGIDCILDQYTPHPSEGWPRWMDRNTSQADFVLMICTQTYFARVMGHEKKGTGLGVKWEGNLIYNKIYNNDSANDKFIPLLFKPEDKQYIPGPLEGCTFYLVTDKNEYDKLYRRLTKQPLTIKPDPGTVKKMEPEQVPSTAFHKF